MNRMVILCTMYKFIIRNTHIITFIIINFKFYFKFYFEIIFYIMEIIQDKILRKKRRDKIVYVTSRPGEGWVEGRT